MRMIPKFRAKDEKGVWHTGLLTFMFGQYAIVNESDENTVYLIDKETVGQSTALTGKDGVEIFEGDIVRPFDVGFSYKGVVTQDSVTCWWIKGIDPDDNFQFEDIADYRDYTCDLEVIGNIYENRDLLEVSK